MVTTHSDASCENAKRSPLHPLFLSPGPVECPLTQLLVKKMLSYYLSLKMSEIQENMGLEESPRKSLGQHLFKSRAEQICPRRQCGTFGTNCQYIERLNGTSQIQNMPIWLASWRVRGNFRVPDCHPEPLLTESARICPRAPLRVHAHTQRVSMFSLKQASSSGNNRPPQPCIEIDPSRIVEFMVPRPLLVQVVKALRPGFHRNWNAQPNFTSACSCSLNEKYPQRERRGFVS